MMITIELAIKKILNGSVKFLVTAVTAVELMMMMNHHQKGCAFRIQCMIRYREICNEIIRGRIVMKMIV